MSEQSTVIQLPNRPLLRYFGGKWMLAPWVLSHFPVHAKYIESFGGGGSILLSKPVVHAEIYNDLDSEIVNLFSAARSNLPELLDQIKLTPYAREEFEQSYEPCESALKQARRTRARRTGTTFCEVCGAFCIPLWPLWPILDALMPAAPPTN
jgi:DNA adenine methylase